MTRDLFRMRSYQRAPYLARKNGCKRFVEVVHRRGGKDRNWLNITFLEMLERVGVYFHVFPTLNQGKRDIWDNIIHERMADGTERAVRMIEAGFPPELVAAKDETEMQITLKNGSIWQVMGADDKKQIDRLRGPNPIGIALSEYAFMNKYVWEVLSPVLAENGGWVAFFSTPNMEDDAFHKLYISAQTDPTWFHQLLTVDDTRRDAEGEDGSPVVPLSEIEDLRKHGTREESIQREYYCSFKGFVHGTIYGDLISAAIAEKRIGRFPYIPQLPVGICFDLGKSDTTAVWFYQILPSAINTGLINDQIRFIDYHEETLKDSQWWFHYLREQKRYVYGRMILPWDGYIAETYYSSVGFRNIHVCQRTKSIRDSIDAVRLHFRTFYFDEERCARGIECLTKYKRKWDEMNHVFIDEPVHDQFSHGADSLRTGVEGGFGPLLFVPGWNQEIKVESDFDPRLGGM